jgi:two-component system nitrate/nitrite response regulator NarL
MGRGEPAALAWDDNTRLPGLVLTSGLTPRELEVVSVIVEGASNRDIAHLFSISENTVKHHLTRIFDKVGVSTRLELAVRAAASR